MKSLTELKKEHLGVTRLLWHSDYWDGPLTGLMLWNGEKTWFRKVDERHEKEMWSEKEIKEWEDDYEALHPDDYCEYDTFFIYKVYKLSLEQLNALEYNHHLFRKYVGVHCDYDEEGSRYHGPGYLRPYSEHNKFYDRKKHCTVSDIDYSDKNVIGEFEY